MSTLQPFDAMKLPLHGVRLIEASAGTGKTYSITTLYLRLLLEQDRTVEQILVVTFTNAATEELGERIRERLASALRFLEQGDWAAHAEEDAILAEWLRERPDAEADRVRLRAALAGMDQAAISTIHGLAQRVLREQAFDTGAPFEAEFLEDESELRARAARDFWRRWLAAEIAPRLRDYVLDAIKGPDALLARLRTRLNDTALIPQPDTGTPEEEGEALLGEEQALEKRWEGLKQAYVEHGAEAEDLVRYSEALNRNRYRESGVEKALTQLRALCEGERPLADLEAKFELLTTETLQASVRKGKELPHNPLFDACDDYWRQAQQVQARAARYRIAFLREARAAIRENLDRYKEQAQVLAFDDLLDRLAAALDGEQGDALAARLRERYPVAMIDEFQDTDAVQYRIFSRVYGEAGDTNEKHGLFLIGDPKQAIYGFRGGDIFTYLRAARDARSRYGLDTNWRSSSRLLAAFNTLFGSRADAFVQPGIDYQPVKPSPRADEKPLRIDGEAPVPLQCWRLWVTEGKAIKVDDARDEAADHCARHIAWLLDGHATLDGEPLQAGDIALLVDTHKQAEQVQAALRRAGVASVHLGNDSVFESAEAADLLHLLQALAGCEDARLLRGALGGPLLGHDAAQLAAWLADDAAWEAVQERFFDYRRIWEERGFIQAFMRLLHDEDLAARLLAGPQGERRLTNLLQLAELCQHASAAHPGIEPLLRWLEAQIRLGAGGEAQRQRLESDARLVKVVTLHASKGLEYPVVYVPFPWHGKDSPKPGFLYHDSEGRACLWLGTFKEAPPEVQQAWREESLAESMRLFYVALTRAARLCVLCWGRVNKGQNSALAALLYSGEHIARPKRLPDEAEVFAPLERLAEACPEGIAVCDPPEASGTPPRVVDRSGLQARPFEGRIDSAWRVSSYSGLISGHDSDRPDFDAQAGEEAAPAAPDPVQALPASARFGIFIHGLLEQLDFTTFEPQAARPLTERLALRHGLGGLDLAAVDALLQRVLATPLPGVGLALGELPRARRLDEMEFHFRVHALTPARLQAALADLSDWAGAADGLDFHGLQGLLHGFVDLVFEHQGRFHVVDYKSNRLDDYGPESLAQAMQAHRYPLQALIYGLALHRHLQQRLPGYDPARHLGGVHYLFLRGMAPGGGAGIWQRPLTPALIVALERAFGGEAAA